MTPAHSAQNQKRKTELKGFVTQVSVCRAGGLPPPYPMKNKVKIFPTKIVFKILFYFAFL
jgi:hypothetical protein